MKQCPRCGLTNTDSASRCDCGRSFPPPGPSTGETHADRGELLRALGNARAQMWAGGMIVLFALALLVISLVQGQHLFIWYGLFVFGGGLFLRGSALANRLKR